MGRGKLEAKITKFIRSYFSGSGKRVAIVGLSGGLDSAVVLALCARALGKGNVVAAMMPSKSTPVQDMEDAASLAKMLGVKAVSFQIEPVLRAYGSLAGGRMARANLSARARMAALYAIAGAQNGLVVGTGDRSEFLLGYFTKHGDGGADIFPIAGLYKTEVRELALRLGIPAAIVNKPSSPALWKGQTAEAEFGFSYETADGILKGVGSGVQRSVLEKKFGKKAVVAVLKRMKQNRHKSIPAPVCRI